MTEYEKYQLQWMIDHGYSLGDLMQGLRELQYTDPEDSDLISTPVDELFDKWVNDVGFGSEIWACEAEWKDCEGKCEDYSSKTESDTVEKRCYIVTCSCLDETGLDVSVGDVFDDKSDAVEKMRIAAAQTMNDLIADKEDPMMTRLNNGSIVIRVHGAIYKWKVICRTAFGRGSEALQSEAVTEKPVREENVARHESVCRELNALYEKKNHDYGDSFHKTFVEEGMAMARIRLGDKFLRFKTLTKGQSQRVSDESVRDTLIDLANYAILTVMEMDRCPEEES